MEEFSQRGPRGGGGREFLYNRGGAFWKDAYLQGGGGRRAGKILSKRPGERVFGHREEACALKGGGKEVRAHFFLKEEEEILTPLAKGVPGLAVS